ARLSATQESRLSSLGEAPLLFSPLLCLACRMHSRAEALSGEVRRESLRSSRSSVSRFLFFLLGSRHWLHHPSSAPRRKPGVRQAFSRRSLPCRLSARRRRGSCSCSSAVSVRPRPPHHQELRQLIIVF